MKKSIWIFNHYAVTPDLPGGTRHFDFGKELVKRGYNVAIFASSFIHGIFENKKLNGGESWRIENYEGVRFVWIRTFPYKRNDWKRILNMLSYSWRAYKIGKKVTEINKFIGRPDIIIGSSVHLFAGFTAYELSRYYKVPFIFEVRDLWPQTLIDIGGFSSFNPIIIFFRSLEKFLYKKASKIITLLPKASDYIVSLGIDKEKIIWIPNGIGVDRFKKIGEVAINDSSVFKVVYAGSHGIANDLETFVKAAYLVFNRGYKNIFFELIGDGPQKNYLKDLAESLGISNINFKDPVSKERIPYILNSADVLWAGLKKKNIYKYGISLNKIFDYMSAGKPIIFSGDSFNNPIIDAEAGIKISPEDPEELAEAVIRLYNMTEEKRKKMGENGRRYVEKHYSVKVLTNLLEKVIKEAGNE